MPKTAVSKPSKPYPTFPLCAHNGGRWCVKVKGRFTYYEKWREDRDGSISLAQFQAERDDLHAGRKPRSKSNREPTLAHALNAFLSFKLLAMQAGELSDRSYHDYERVCDRVATSIGKHRLLSDIDHSDLERLRADFARGKRGGNVAPKTLASELTRARSIFLYMNDNLLEKPIKYRRSLQSPSRRLMRQSRNSYWPSIVRARRD